MKTNNFTDPQSNLLVREVTVYIYYAVWMHATVDEPTIRRHRTWCNFFYHFQRSLWRKKAILGDILILKGLRTVAIFQ
mgnify:CR=1 FL=1